MPRGMTKRSRLLRYYLNHPLGVGETDQTLIFGFFDEEGLFRYCSPENVKQMVEEHGVLNRCWQTEGNIGYYIESGDARKKVDLRGLDVDELLAEGRTVM
jgi:hypothetical protein